MVDKISADRLAPVDMQDEHQINILEGEEQAPGNQSSHDGTQRSGQAEGEQQADEQHAAGEYCHDVMFHGELPATFKESGKTMRGSRDAGIALDLVFVEEGEYLGNVSGGNR